MQWAQCQKDFKFDGLWIDIYILNTDRADWNRFLRSLLNSKYPIAFWIDGEIAKPITTIQEALNIGNYANPLMHIDVFRVHVACHFFTDKEIELDIDPREVNSQQDLDRVVDFMMFLGNCLQKKVILTPENSPHLIIIEFDPKTQAICYYQVDNF